MGNKPSNIFQMDRPESGGADRDQEREASGLLDQAKQEFAEAQTRRRRNQASRAPELPSNETVPAEGHAPSAPSLKRRRGKRR
jgi:hypothetical protein